MSRILCLDIGSGTQDVLYYDSEVELENCLKFVLPSPARRVAARVAALTAEGRNIYLYGCNMGGGFGRAVRRHVGEGFGVAAHPAAAYSLGDKLEWVAESGVEIRGDRPEGYVPVYLSDYDPGFWSSFLGMAGAPEPDFVMAAAQDHGFHGGESNRRGRFRLWESFLLEAGGRPEALVYETPPEMLTRLAALQAGIGGGLVSDTASAAVLGALFVPEIEALTREAGAVVLNMGNSHVLAALVFQNRIWGIYEQHSGLRSPEEILADLEKFRRSELTNDEVFAARGHGCLTLDAPKEAGGFPHLVVLGPKRGLIRGVEALFPSPGGDMMLAGCFGLLKGLACLRGE